MFSPPKLPGKKILVTGLLVLVLCLNMHRLNGDEGSDLNTWRVLPIRSQGEFEQGMIGGEAEQHLHSIARCLAHPEVIYLSQDVGGVWRSIDDGETWQKTLDHGLYINNGQSIAVNPVNPNIVFIEVDNAYNYRSLAAEGLYRSEDGGDHWTRVLATPTNYNPSIGRSLRQAIAFDHGSIHNGAAQRWYAAFPDNGLYRSEDGGWSFGTEPVSPLTGHGVVFSVNPVPDNDQTVFVATNLGLYISTRRGEGLQAIGNLPDGPVTSLAIDGRDTDHLYAVVDQKGLYRSVNGGHHFTLVKSFPATRGFMNPGYPDTYFLIGNQYTIATHDGGKTWIENAVSIGHPETGVIRSGNAMEVDGKLAGLVPHPRDPDEAVGFAKASIWKTTDGGRTYIDSSTLFTGYAWSWWNRGAAFDRFDPQRFAFFNNDVGMTLTTTGGDFFFNRNPEAWAWYQGDLIEWIGAYAGDFQSSQGSDRMVAAVGGYFNTQLMRSSNAGQSWALLVDPDNLEETLEKHLFVAFHPNDPSFVYAGDKVSTDAGFSFTPIEFGAFAGQDPYVVGFCEAQPDTVYAISDNGRMILRSDDRGSDWRTYASLNWNIRPFDSIPTFACHSTDPDVIYTIDRFGDLARFDGDTWTSLGVLDLVEGGSQANGYYNYVRTTTVDPNDGEIVYAGMFSSGIDCAWRSMDGGTTWQNITANLPRFGLSTMAVNPHTGELFVGTLGGTWILPAPYESDNLVYAKAEPQPPGDLLPSMSYEAWRLGSFSWKAFLDDSISGLQANPDSDSGTNFAEYAFGGDPLAPELTEPHRQSIGMTDSGQSNVLQFIRRAGDPVIEFELQSTEDLDLWQPVNPSRIVHLQTESLPGDLETIEFHIEPRPPFTDTEFFRLRARLSPSK